MRPRTVLPSVIEPANKYESEFYAELAGIYRSHYDRLAQEQLAICLRGAFSSGMTRKEKREQATTEREQLKARYLAAYQTKDNPYDGVAAMDRLCQRFTAETPTKKTQFLEALGLAWKVVEAQAKAYQAEMQRRRDEKNLAFLRLLQAMGSINTHLTPL